MTLKQFINFARMVSYQFACEHSIRYYDYEKGREVDADLKTNLNNLYRGIYDKTPLVVCVDGTQISVQTHSGSHCIFEDVKPYSGFYNDKFNLSPVMVETDCEELNQYGIDNIEDVEKYINSHGGIDIDASIEYIYYCLIK